jgi:hypothetical protein
MRAAATWESRTTRNSVSDAIAGGETRRKLGLTCWNSRGLLRLTGVAVKFTVLLRITGSLSAFGARVGVELTLGSLPLVLLTAATLPYVCPTLSRETFKMLQVFF